MFSTDRAVFATQNSETRLGSHYDMLHQTPFCRGIAWESGNIYWAFNAYDNTIDKYNFNAPHEKGGDDHSDGEIYKIVEEGCGTTRYCTPAVPNSTGQPGMIDVTGSLVVADDDLTLTATQLPTTPNIGYFLMGQGMNTSVPPGSAGPICVTPGLLRILPPVSNTNELPGGFSRSVGTSGPQTSNITPGSTWNFQAWHRDFAAGTSNLTDAVSATFCN